MKLNLKNMNYQEIQEQSGIYLIQFLNNKFYIGSSSNVKKRLYDHYLNLFIYEKPCSKWYLNARLFLKQLNINEKNFFYKVNFFVQYTETKTEARLLEKQALSEIYKNNKEYCYYNSIFYHMVDLEYKPVKRDRKWNNPKKK